MEEYNHLNNRNNDMPSRGSFFYACGRSDDNNNRNSDNNMSDHHHNNNHHSQIPPSCFQLQASENLYQSNHRSHLVHDQNEAASSSRFYPPQFIRKVQENNEERPSISEVESMKAKIVAHPQYSSLLQAYIDCQKIGAPPQVVARLNTGRQEIESRQQRSRDYDESHDPELDQFMEAYCNMLVKYQEELSRPMQEAREFMRRVETQLKLHTNSSISFIDFEAKCEGNGLSEDDQDNSGGETEAPEIDPRAEDRELKSRLLKKYSGYLSGLKQELSTKKKKGKLPKEARQKLLTWWELHYKWPYPSESEKVALAETTGLDQKQINNWFINQRKRHWKPSEDMQFMAMDGLRPQSNAAFYIDGRYMGDGCYRLGP